jgi:P4 family phage/plasmid primase-like protien
MTSLTLRSYLDSRRTSGADWNITGMGGEWMGKFSIPEEEYDDFLELVHEHVFEKGRACSLLEKHRAQGPILIDLDFRYAAGGPLRRRFTDEHLRQFVAAYADAFAHFFEPTEDPLQFFVMVKPAPEAEPAKDIHKDGVHIVCPTVTLTPEVQYAIRGWLLQNSVIERIFESTGMTNEPQDCLDISVISRNNWFLYGACKPNKAWYKVEKVYAATVPDDDDDGNVPTLSVDMLEEVPVDSWDDKETLKLLSIRKGHDSVSPVTLRTGAAEADWTQLLQRWGKGSNWAKPKSPGLFGARATAATTEDMPSMSLSSSNAAAASSDGEDMIQVSGITVRSGYTAEDIALGLRIARECLNPARRAKEYHDWVNLGLLLHNITTAQNGSGAPTAATEDAYRAWAELSRRVPGFSRTPESVYKEKWALLPAESSAIQRGRKPLMMGTLHHWAKEDSEAAYKAIMAEENRNRAYLNDSGTHVSVAEQVISMYRNEFRCTPLRKGASAAAMDWFQFTGHTWQNLKTFMALRARLSNEVRNTYIQADRKAGELITQATTEDERQRLEAKRKNLFKVEANLQNSGFKDSVMKEAAEKFYDEDFLSNMNQNTCLVGFSNGVLELRHPGSDGQPHVFFRPGRPDDCISFQMGRGMVGMDAIPYVPYDPEHPVHEHLEILDFFKKIYPDPVLREYCLTLYSACLEGANHEQKFYIMSGSGGNGKSKIIDLMSKTFGEYQESLPVTALTRKRADAGSANPEMIVLKCRRFISMVEPEEGERINTSLMKQLSGQDTLKARGLFQDQDQFVVTARIFMSCNELPAVSSMDDGTWRRLRVIPHVSTFVEEGKSTNPAANVHPRDPLLDSKIIKWRPYFAGMLAWYYENRYLRGGFKEPAQVTSASDRYKEENDLFAAFAQDCMVREVGAEARLMDVMGRYKIWTTYNPGKKTLQKKDIIQRMTALYGNPIDGQGKVYGGVRILEEGEDLSGNTLEFTA